MAEKKKLPSGLVVSKWENYHVSALQALSRGEANPEQQKLALQYIINNVCLTYDMPYRPESSRDTDFLLGRMYAGQQIVKLLKINLNKIKEKNDGK